MYKIEEKADDLVRRLFDFANGAMYQLPPESEQQAVELLDAIVAVAGEIVKEARQRP